MRSIWSIVRQTFAQCVRMKVAVAFIVMMAAALVVLPMIMTGDDTLAGQIRAFLSYSTGITGILLSLLTVFVGASLVSSDVRDKLIFTVAVKPVSRWQYIFGRWIGLVLLNVVLLGLSGIAIYATSQYLRTKTQTRLGEVSMMDRRAVESEVFTARQFVEPQNIKDVIGKRLKARLEEMKANNELGSAISAFQEQQKCGPERAVELLQASIAKQLYDQHHTISTGKTITWQFEGVNVQGQETRDQSKVAEPLNGSTGMLLLETSRSLVGSLLHGRPVVVKGFEARIMGFRDERIVVQFKTADLENVALTSLKKGDKVELIVEPILQIKYKISPVGSLPGDKFSGIWTIENRSTGYRVSVPADAPAKRKASLMISARSAGDDGKITVTLKNNTPGTPDNPATVKVLSADVGILYKVASFEANFARAMLLMLCQMIFLSAVSVFAGSFVSFPVACLFCFALLPFSVAREFLVDATKGAPAEWVNFFALIANWIVRAMVEILPDFARTMPGTLLVDGMNISWGFWGMTFLLDVVLRAGVVLLIACALFHRRELARVQV